jgi:hypothetical protein
VQLLDLDQLVLWEMCLGVKVASLLPDAAAERLPEPYRSVLRLTPGQPPVFDNGQHAVNWETLAAAVGAHAAGAAAVRAEHLLTEGAVAAQAGLLAVRQGIPSALVTLASDEPLFRIALRRPIDVRIVVSTERTTAHSGAVRLLSALLRSEVVVVAVLGTDAMAVLGETAPSLMRAASKSVTAIRLQDLRAAGLTEGVPERDIEVAMESRLVVKEGLEVWALRPKT